MNKIEIYNEIKRISDTLSSNNSSYTRADLAFELSNYGFTNDSLEISKLVWEAYEYFNNHQNIKDRFYNNDGNEKIVDSYKAQYLISKQDTSNLIVYTENRNLNAKDSLYQLENLLNTHGDSEIAKMASSLLDTITGTKGVKRVKENAEIIFNKYEDYINTYQIAKDNIKAITADFLSIREDIFRRHKEISYNLIDIFGNDIIYVAPNLFDFDKIEFHDTQNMFEIIKLKFDELSEDCVSLMGIIFDNFSNSLSESANAYRRYGSNSLGLVMASVTMINHYFTAQNNTIQLEKELSNFRSSIKYDISLLKSDFGRLSLIFKTINDIFLPTAQVFYKKSDKVFNDFIQEINDILHTDKDLFAKIESRSKFLHQMQLTNDKIVDCNLNIDYYLENIEKTKFLIESKEDEYAIAKNAKPSRPNFIINLFTLGKSKSNYYRKTYEWQHSYYPVIELFEASKVDLKLDIDELEIQRTRLKKNNSEAKRIELEISKLNEEIRNGINISPETKKILANKLQDIVNLLYISKSIIESKLDQKHLKKVDFRKPMSHELPDNVIHNLNGLISNFGNIIHLDEKSTLNLTANILEHIDNDEEKGFEALSSLNEEQILEISDKYNQMIESGLSLAKEFIELQQMKNEEKVSSEHYDRLVSEKLQEFKSEHNKIDIRSDELKDLISEINNISDIDDLKKTMVLLSKKQKSLSEKDIELFFQGKKTIKL